MLVFLFFLRGHLPRFNPLAGHHDRSLIAGSLDQAVHPALEAEAVDHYQVGAAHGLGSRRRRLVDMGIAVGPHQRGNLDPVAADILHHVAQDAETGDYLDLVLGPGLSGAAGEAESQEDPENPNADPHFLPS